MNDWEKDVACFAATLFISLVRNLYKKNKILKKKNNSNVKKVPYLSIAVVRIQVHIDAVINSHNHLLSVLLRACNHRN